MKIKLLIISFVFCACCPGQGKFYGGNGDGFSSASILNIVLPLQVTGFSISEKNNAAAATLIIASSAEHVCGIMLERSKDATSFIPVDSLKAAYPGLPGNRFQLNDISPLSGRAYYRVGIIQCNGRILYTNIEPFFMHSINDHFYYLPASNCVHYNISVKGKIEIMNSTGQLVYYTSLAAGSGIINIPPVSRGIYLLRFSNKAIIKILVQ